MTKRVAIIYLTFYDQPHYLDEAILSIEQQSFPRENLALVVVDNSCHGPSAQYIRERVVPQSGVTLPEVVFIENNENVGFAEGNNQGMRFAMEQGFDYVFLLNNDAKLDTRAIEEAVAMAETDASIGAVQSLLLLWQKSDMINSSGNDIHFLGFGLVRDYGKTRSLCSRGDGEDIGYASGSAVLYRIDALREVGLLESFFWMYHEDLEFGWRLRLAGWRSVLSLSSIVYHDYSFSRSTEKMFWMERNRWLVHLSHVEVPTLVLLLPALVLMDLAVMAGAVRGGWFMKKLRSSFALLSPACLAYVKRARREVKTLRKISDREAMQSFVGKIEHQETDVWLVRYLLNPVLSLYWNVIRGFIQ